MTPALRAKLVAAVADIADALDHPPRPADGDVLLEMGLAGGNAGYALFYAELDRVSPSARWKRIGQRHLRAARRRVPQGSNRPFFAYGFSGAGWVFEHLARWSGGIGTDALPDIDDALHMLVEEAQTVAYDMQYGLVGFGTYALERLPAASAKRLLAAVVARLARTSMPGTVGRTWRSVNAVFVEGPHLAALARGIYDPGVFNGVAGVVGVLAGAVAANVAKRTARPLLEDALAWVWSRRSMYAAPRDVPSWSNGRLGVAAVCYAAARAAKLETWQRRWLSDARRIANTSLRLSHTALFEGAAGTAHIYRRLYRATGDATFLAASERDVERLVRRRRPGRGLAGYTSWIGAWEATYLREDQRGPVGAVGVPGFLTGIAGIGVVLLEALHDRPSEWDRALLLSHRVRD